eukprot:TRINITY_DN79742_c0_g1_i1.p1 TRINITY_DN79742_c0_g1~~TRINITY_DN79742_c0_g1_i1.p1  ORF type:complete len:468 (+),score=85.03 TRINITY_DN79742_c0_g1_i1:64-1404(+)
MSDIEKNILSSSAAGAQYGSMHEHRPRQTRRSGLSTGMCSTMIVAYACGVGVLGLPENAAVLGWVPFLFAFVAFSAAFIFSSVLYVRLYQAVPSAKSLGDVAGEAFGLWGRWIIAALQSGFMISFAVLLHITAAFALAGSGGGHSFGVGTSAMAGAMLLVLLQAQRLQAVGIMSIAGTATILVACSLLLTDFACHGRWAGARTDIATKQGWVPICVSLASLVNAFSGQHVWIELQAESRQPEEFPKAVKTAATCIVLTYAIVATMGYYYVGAANLSSGAPIIVYASGAFVQKSVGILALLHTVIAYILNGNLLVRNLLRSLLSPSNPSDSCKDGYEWNDDQDVEGDHSPITWFLGTSALVTVSGLAAVEVPFFDSMAGINGAFFLFLLTYTVPIMLALKLLPLGHVERLTYQVLAAASVAGCLVAVQACTASLVMRLQHVIAALQA